MTEFNYEECVEKAKSIAEELSKKSPQEYLQEAAQKNLERKNALKAGESITTKTTKGVEITRQMTYGGVACDSFKIPHNMVGFIIGHKGEALKRIEMETHTRIHIEREGGPERLITIQGKPHDVDAARIRIEEHMEMSNERSRQRRRLQNQNHTSHHGTNNNNNNEHTDG
ncbi:hypothetical protein MP228_007985 [Amoeboaphelidium protococcarum]|nr:hypothetical protein MP228_007985 [Amoeboaphelidium protococcarum]